MSDKKYTVFISSTFDDLGDQREGAMRTVLEYGHFPLGMELWGASSAQQWKIIQRQIDIADYYLVIVAHRYGSQAKDSEFSWTEREFDYALERGVPILGFIIDPDAEWKPKLQDPDKAQLDAFKAKIRERPVSFWKDTNDLRFKIGQSLSLEIQATPRIGWVRATEAASPEVANQLARLMHENEAFKARLDEISKVKLPDIGFEISEANLEKVWADERSRLEGTEDFILNTTMIVEATTRDGKSVGFSPKACSVNLVSDNSIRIAMAPEVSDADGGFIEQVKITGPTRFMVMARASISMAQTPSDTVILEIKLRPIGYDDAYILQASLEKGAQNRTRTEWHLSTNS